MTAYYSKKKACPFWNSQKLHLFAIFTVKWVSVLHIQCHIFISKPPTVPWLHSFSHSFILTCRIILLSYINPVVVWLGIQTSVWIAHPLIMEISVQLCVFLPFLWHVNTLLTWLCVSPVLDLFEWLVQEGSYSLIWLFILSEIIPMYFSPSHLSFPLGLWLYFLFYTPGQNLRLGYNINHRDTPSTLASLRIV